MEDQQVRVMTSRYRAYYNPFLVYCRELAPGTVSLTGDRAQGDDSKHDSHFNSSIPNTVMGLYKNISRL